MKLRFLVSNGKTTLQYWNTPEGWAPHWKDVPVVQNRTVEQNLTVAGMNVAICQACGGSGRTMCDNASGPCSCGAWHEEEKIDER